MDLPFDLFPYAGYVKELSSDIVDKRFRDMQIKLSVPSVSKLTARFLYMNLIMLKPKNILEIGCGIGASTYVLNIASPESFIVTMDGNKFRTEISQKLLGDTPNIKIHHAIAEDLLPKLDMKFDFVFVDSIKKEYLNIWKLLVPLLSPNAVVIFDDVLLYGHTAEVEENVPTKYRAGREALRLFLDTMVNDSSLFCQLIPVDGGLLFVRKL